MGKKRKTPFPDMPDASTPAPPQFDIRTIKRLFSYMKEYKAALIIVVVCILLSSIASAVSALFIQILIDDYIVPILAMDTPVFTGLIRALITVGGIYLIGIVEVLKVGQQIIDANRMQYPNGSLWVYAAIFFLYFIICWPISLLSKYLEKRWK